jgi:hypothetical protein
MEVGWRSARHAWHYGYATEAARAALGVAFDNMGLPEIWSMTAASQAVMRRLGLTETTRFDHPRIPPGDPLRPQVAYHGTRPPRPNSHDYGPKLAGRVWIVLPARRSARTCGPASRDSLPFRHSGEGERGEPGGGAGARR